ncbi:hypothetical protein ACXDSS_004506 [Klebsiella quasipneumoniae]
MRVREILGQNSITIVSLAFQNQQAIHLAQHYGINAFGLNAEDMPAEQQRLLGTVREYVVRSRAILDASFISGQPHFTGQEINTQR